MTRVGLLRSRFMVNERPGGRPHDRCGQGESVANAGFTQFPLDPVRGLKRLPAGVVGRQPYDAPAFDQVVMLLQEELPALGRRGPVEDHHAQAGDQADQVPERLDARAQLRRCRVAVDEPRVGIPRDDPAVIDAGLAEKPGSSKLTGIVLPSGY
jgi:hypothetical protein